MKKGRRERTFWASRTRDRSLSREKIQTCLRFLQSNTQNKSKKRLVSQGFYILQKNFLPKANKADGTFEIFELTSHCPMNPS